MLFLSRLTRMKGSLGTAFSAASIPHGWAATVLVFSAIHAAHSAALTGGRFVEADGWKARITVDCLLKDKVCGSFRYETLACEGDLIYSGETATGFDSAPSFAPGAACRAARSRSPATSSAMSKCARTVGTKAS
jgi:hypothetical protein